MNHDNAIGAILATCRDKTKAVCCISDRIIKAAKTLIEDHLPVSSHADRYEIQKLAEEAFEEIEQIALDSLDSITHKNRFRSAYDIIHVDEVVHDILNDWLDSRERIEDPYRYFGVRREDFF